MPGILPMKVIRIGNNSQSRIAQACDRCRSKKIRCDGIRPCCTQCANVGFECKTSDKLSRRAFPRGYTESLEDRVRGLEAEVRELKDLLDEKDEKIDMLSRIHNFSPPSRKGSSCLSPGISAQVKAELESAREDVLHVETAVPAEPATPSLGSSSIAAFMTAFDDKVQESGRQVPNILPTAFVPQAVPASPVSPRDTSKVPPRLLSDQYINLFFQEWQPLLPIFHRPTFLRVYEQYLVDPEARQWHSNKQAIAQLYLIFDIAAQSSTSRSKQSVTSHEPQWRKALHSTSANASLSTLQCHVLAELYYLLKADYARLARHRAIAVSMCHQLGLHQCQNYPSLPVLEAETRKKVFWCQYVLDKFTSAATGTPMLFREADITTEYPADVDDENVSIQGFSPTLPGEITKLSSALALFKASRILSKTLEQLYPAKASYQLSLTKLHAISDELDQWSTNLPAHLRLQFCKDKPSTNVISCRSPLLFLAYFYIRSLIHRPIVCHGSGSTASASTIVLAAAAKHVVQIFDLLDERRMNYTFPLNKAEFLLSSGFSLLWQCLDLEPHSKLVMDNQKSLTMLIDILNRDSQTAGCEFLRVASSFVTIGSAGRREQTTTQVPRRIDIDANASRTSVSLMPAPAEKQKSTRKQLQAIASRFSAFGNRKPDDAAGRRATVPREVPSTSASPRPHPHHRTYSSVSVSSTRSTPVIPMCSPVPARLTQSRTIDLPTNVNLDYFPIGEEDSHTHSSSTTTLPNKHTPDHGLCDTSWEQLLTNIDNASMYSGIYTNHTNGSVSPNGVHKAASSMSGSQEWPTPSTDEAWPSLSAIDLSLPSKNAVPQSVLSFSEESLTSQEDLVFSVASSNNGSTATSDSLDAHDKGLSGFKGIAMPTVDDEFDFHDLDGNY